LACAVVSRLSGDGAWSTGVRCGVARRIGHREPGGRVMAHRLCTSVVGSLVFACAMGTPAMAEDAAAQPAEAGTAQTDRYEVAEEDVSLELTPERQRVDLAITPYIWLPSLSGSMTVKGTELDVDQTFLDTLDKSEFMFGLMGA